MYAPFTGLERSVCSGIALCGIVAEVGVVGLIDLRLGTFTDDVIGRIGIGLACRSLGEVAAASGRGCPGGVSGDGGRVRRVNGGLSARLDHAIGTDGLILNAALVATSGTTKSGYGINGR